MALKNVHTNKKTKKNVHKQGVESFRQAIGDQRFYAIKDWMLGQFDKSEWVNTTFVAPTHWGDTPLEVIWDYFHTISDHDERHRQSAIMYGCIFYTVLFDQPETYLFHRHEGLHSDETTPYGLTYRRDPG